MYDSRIASDCERLLDGPEFVEAAHRLCYYDLTTVVDNPTFRLELIAAAAAEGDEVIQEALDAQPSSHRLGTAESPESGRSPGPQFRTAAVVGTLRA
ncbi:hypothetical protein [Streptomyces sp. NPDC001089]